MATAEELQVIIDAKVSDAVRDLKKVDKSLGQADKSTKKMDSSMSRLIKRFGAMAAAAVSITAITKAVKASVAAFRTQEEAEAQLRGALLATGKAAGGTAEELQTLASELQGVTTFGDEATLEATALLQSLGDLSSDGLQQIIPLVQDFATGMGMDLTNAAQLVGKTLGSSTNALTRYGIEIDASASKSEKLDQLTDALGNKFGGLSQEMANTASGGLTQLGNAFGDLQEQMGQRFLSSAEPIIGWLKNVVTNATEAAEQANNLNDALERIGEGAAPVSLQQAQQDLAAIQAEIRKLEDAEGAGATARRQRLRGQERAAIERVKNLELVAYWQGRVKDETGELAAETDKLSQGEKDYIEVTTALQTELQQIAQRNAALGDSYDEQGAKADAVRSALDELISRGYKTANLNIQTLLNTHGELLDSMDEEVQAINTVGRMWDTLTMSALNANAVTVEAAKQTTEAIIQMSQEQQRILDAFVNGAMGVMSELGSFLSAQTSAQVQDYKNSQKEQIEALEAKKEAGIITEEEYQAARQRLEEKTQRKIAAAQKKQAQRQKAISIFQSITNTAVGVTKALAQSGNPVLAGIIGALGAAQTALIAATPIPEFATGGSFTTNGPEVIQVGDNPGGRERVTVEPTSSEIGSGGGGGSANVYLDGERLGKWVEGEMRAGRILVPQRAIV